MSELALSVNSLHCGHSTLLGVKRTLRPRRQRVGPTLLTQSGGHEF
jgi:hypothetical protein